MQPGHRSRAARRAASETAILDAAVEHFATSGPDGVSLRELARTAGLTHALVARYFGSKQGLVSAVEEWVSSELISVTEGVDVTSEAALADLLTQARAHPTLTRLTLRSGLGDLDHSIVPVVLTRRCSTASRGDRRSRLCGYAAASLLLGWLSWDGYLALALQLEGESHPFRDEAVAAATASLLQLATRTEPALEPRQLGPADEPSPAPPPDSARDALLAAAVELFAEHGPASVSIRDVARHAGVNHGLVHRHFGGKDDLLAEALEVGASALVPAATAPGGFDIDTVVHAVHHGSPSPKTIARVLIDDIAVGDVRRHFPVLRGLLAFAHQLPTGTRPDALADPRLAAAAAASMVNGSVIWGRGLRDTFGLTEDEGVESAMADLSRWLLGAPGVHH